MNEKNIKIVAIVAVAIIVAVVGTVLVNRGDNASDEQGDETTFTQNTVTDTTTDAQGNVVTTKTATMTITEKRIFSAEYRSRARYNSCFLRITAIKIAGLLQTTIQLTLNTQSLTQGKQFQRVIDGNFSLTK